MTRVRRCSGEMVLLQQSTLFWECGYTTCPVLLTNTSWRQPSLPEDEGGAVFVEMSQLLSQRYYMGNMTLDHGIFFSYLNQSLTNRGSSSWGFRHRGCHLGRVRPGKSNEQDTTHSLELDDLKFLQGGLGTKKLPSNRTPASLSSKLSIYTPSIRTISYHSPPMIGVPISRNCRQEPSTQPTKSTR